MDDSILDQIYEKIEAEISETRLGKISRSIYRDAATEIRKVVTQAQEDEKNVVTLLAKKEREMLHTLAARLLEIRVEKTIKAMEEKGEAILSELDLTSEERYVLSPIILYRRRKKKVSDAIRNAQLRVLQSVSDKASKDSITVRFLKPFPATVGADIARYGPFQKEDVAVIPSENARILIRQGVAEEVWVED